MRVRDPARVERIIATAAELFGEFGYNEVRMEDIAVRAGVAKGTLYLYFKDKDDLFLALILQRMSQLFDQVQALAAAAKNPEEKLLIMVRESFEYFRSQPHIFAVIQRLDTAGSAGQIEALRASRERFLNLSASFIAELKPTAQGNTHDPQLAARILCGMMREILFSPPATTYDLPRQILQLFLHGILHSGAEP